MIFDEYFLHDTDMQVKVKALCKFKLSIQSNLKSFKSSSETKHENELVN